MSTLLLGRCHSVGVVTGASFILAGAGAVVCSVVFVSLAGFFFFVVATVARFEAADFFAISFASSSALIFFASSLATSSASKDMWWKILGMGTVTLNFSERAQNSPSCTNHEGQRLTRAGDATCGIAGKAHSTAEYAKVSGNSAVEGEALKPCRPRRR